MRRRLIGVAAVAVVVIGVGVAVARTDGQRAPIAFPTSGSVPTDETETTTERTTDPDTDAAVEIETEAGTALAPEATEPGADEPTTAGPEGDALFSESFESEAAMDRFRFQVHDGAGASLTAPENPVVHFHGDHDMDCGGPTTYRDLTNDLTVASAVWYCAPGGDPAKGHFMTGMDTQSYVSIAFTPLTADGEVQVFPPSTSRICWDQNATDLGDRKWTQLAVISAERYTGNLAVVNPDFEVQFGEGAQPLAEDDFMFVNLRNSVQVFSEGAKQADYDGVKGITDKAARYQVCVIDNQDGTITRTTTIPGAHPSTLDGRFPAGDKVVIFQDESYNPDKSLHDGAAPVTEPFYTWHWDNIRIS